MAWIIGDRVILRDYRKEDLPCIREWVNDIEITKYLSNLFIFPHTYNQTENFLNGILEGKNDYKAFIIANKETEEYVGQIDLIKIDWINRVATLGIVIGNNDNLGKGYGTEAIKLMEDFVFNTLNLHKLDLLVADFNERAIACYKKCGFKEEGRIRENRFIDGKYTDTLFMGILRSEYLNK